MIVAVEMSMSLLFRSSAFTKYTMVVIRSHSGELCVSVRHVCWSETLRHTASVPFGPWVTSLPSWEVRTILSYSTLSILMVRFAPTRPLTGTLFQFIWTICMCFGARGGIVVKVLHYNWQVAGSIPDAVVGIFQWHNPSGRTMALGSTQPLTEMSTRCIS